MVTTFYRAPHKYVPPVVEVAKIYPADSDIKGPAIGAIHVTNYVFVLTYEDHKIKTYCEPLIGIDERVVEPVRVSNTVYKIIKDYKPSFYAQSQMNIGLPESNEFHITQLLNKNRSIEGYRDYVADIVKQQMYDVLDRLTPLMKSVSHCNYLRLEEEPTYVNRMCAVMFYREAQEELSSLPVDNAEETVTDL